VTKVITSVSKWRLSFSDCDDMTNQSFEIRDIGPQDEQALLDYFRTLVRVDPERVERPVDVDKITLESERAWIAKRQADERSGEMFVACAVADGRVVAAGEVERAKRWIERHVAEIRFGVLPDYAFVATRLVEELVTRAKANGVEVLIHFHLETQTRGIGVMKECGFEVIGRVPRYYKRGDNYIDRLYLAKTIG
jgi:L-amino acid N-acyltransferase YncA